jgi:hypothetical protein
MSSLRSRSFSSLLTYSRASVASHVSDAGLIVSAAVDRARIDYDPVALTPLGLLLEEARTNLLLRSDNWSATWTAENATQTAAAIMAPSGTVAGTRIVETTDTGLHRYYQSVSKATSSLTYAFSVYVRAAERTRVQLAIEASGNNGYAQFNLANGTVASNGNTGTGFTYRQSDIVAAGGGWYRCSVVVTTDAAAGVLGAVSLMSGAGTISYAGSTSSGLYVWGAQLELGTHPTSYIATTTASVPRSADSAVLTDSSALINRAAGTIIADAYLPYAHGGTDTIYRRLAELRGATNADNLLLYSYQGTTYASAYINTVQVVLLTLGTTPVRTAFRIAYAFGENDHAAVITGGSVQTDTSVGIPDAQESALVGDSANQWNGHVGRLRFYPRRMSNAELLAAVA